MIYHSEPHIYWTYHEGDYTTTLCQLLVLHRSTYSCDLFLMLLCNRVEFRNVYKYLNAVWAVLYKDG